MGEHYLNDRNRRILDFIRSIPSRNIPPFLKDTFYQPKYIPLKDTLGKNVLLEHKKKSLKTSLLLSTELVLLLDDFSIVFEMLQIVDNDIFLLSKKDDKQE
jgi:hypothetical protein